MKKFNAGKTLSAAMLAISMSLILSNVVLADEGMGNADKPSISASRTLTMSATVESIDQETREVTLVGPEGDMMTITAGDEVRNLAQVSAGDIVVAEITENITIEVFANPEGTQPGAGAFSADTAAELGAMPGAAVMDTVVISAVVEEINLEMNTFKLRGPEGNVREFAARNPDNLRKADVGDLVVITISEAVGIAVKSPGD